MHEREYKRAGSGTLTDADDVVVMDMVTTYTNQDPAGDEYYSKYYTTGAEGTDDDPFRDETISEWQRTNGALDLANDSSASLAMSRRIPVPGEPGISSTPTMADASNRKVAEGGRRSARYVQWCTRQVLVLGHQGVHRLDEREAGGLSLGSTSRMRTEAGVWTFTPDGDPARIVVEGRDRGCRLPEVRLLGGDDDRQRQRRQRPPTGSALATSRYTLTADMAGTIIVPPNAAEGAAGTKGVTGTADYAGPAAGIFARRAYDPESGGDVETAGRFTADADTQGGLRRRRQSSSGINGTDHQLHARRLGYRCRLEGHHV